jgi:RimJ/RimL family protein N-acetyltransferase
MIRFEKYSDPHMPMLFHFYTEEEYKEFFRRVPFGLRPMDMNRFEDITKSSLYVALVEEIPHGFCIISELDEYGSTAHVGLVLDKKYWDKEYSPGQVYAHVVQVTFLKQIFAKTQLNKIIMRFLASRTDLEESLLRGGLVKEALLRESVFYDGKFCDELEYTITRKEFTEKYG